MKYFILILTDNNRNALKISMLESNAFSGVFLDSMDPQRLIYQETHESLDSALHRFSELQGYTRMQTERIIRRSNPNWVNLLRPSLRKDYQPGVKFSPNVPKLMSLR